MKFKPRDSLTYSFMLQSMQDYDIFMDEVNDSIKNNPSDKFRHKQKQKAYLGYVGKEFNRRYDKRFKDFYNDKENKGTKSKAYDKEFTTKYQIMIIIDGKSYDVSKHNKGLMEMKVSVVKGYEKPGSNDSDMKDYSDDVLYNRLMKLKDSKTKV